MHFSLASYRLLHHSKIVCCMFVCMSSCFFSICYCTYSMWIIVFIIRLAYFFFIRCSQIHNFVFSECIQQHLVCKKWPINFFSVCSLALRLLFLWFHFCWQMNCFSFFFLLCNGQTFLRLKHYFHFILHSQFIWPYFPFVTNTIE